MLSAFQDQANQADNAGTGTRAFGRLNVLGLVYPCSRLALRAPVILVASLEASFLEGRVSQHEMRRRLARTTSTRLNHPLLVSPPLSPLSASVDMSSFLSTGLQRKVLSRRLNRPRIGIDYQYLVLGSMLHTVALCLCMCMSILIVNLGSPLELIEPQGLGQAAGGQNLIPPTPDSSAQQCPPHPEVSVSVPLGRSPVKRGVLLVRGTVAR